MVGVGPVRRQVLELGQATEIRQRRCVVEQVLIRYRLRCFLLSDRDIGVGLKIAAMEFRGELDALGNSFGVIEAAEDEGLAELAVVEQVPRHLVIGVKAEIERAAVLSRRGPTTENNFLIDAGVEIM